MGLSALQIQHPGDHLIGTQKPVTPVFSIIRLTVVVGVVSSRRIIRIDQGHMAFATLDGFGRISLLVPMARGPVVELVLELHPAHAVDFLIDKLLVTGRTVFGPLKGAFT